MTQSLDDLLMSMNPVFNSLPQRQTSEFEYHGVYDGLVWSDEVPKSPLSDEQEQVVRYLFQYRTGLIMGESNPSLEPLWNNSMRAFPNWPGFAPERCTPAKALARYVSNARLKLESFLEEDANM